MDDVPRDAESTGGITSRAPWITFDVFPFDTRLPHVALNFEDMGDEGVTPVVDAVIQLRTITSLELRTNNVGDEGAEVIARSLEHNDTLTWLDLSCNNIGSQGAQCLGRALRSNRSLVSLVLGGNCIGDEGAAGLAMGIAENPTLCELFLQCNEIGNDGVQKIAEALKRNTSITKLMLNTNGFGAGGAESLSEALLVNSSILHLDISHNWICSSGQAVLHAALVRRERNERTKRLLMALGRACEASPVSLADSFFLRRAMQLSIPPKKADRAARAFDPSAYHQRPVALRVSYLGWNYRGFCEQSDSPNTVEAALFDALARTKLLLVDRPASGYSRCGRTDAGVSAVSQVVALRLRWSKRDPGRPDELPDEPQVDYCSSLNRALPQDIRVLAWAPVADDFDARRECVWRQYKYFLASGPPRPPPLFLSSPAPPLSVAAAAPQCGRRGLALDVERMRRACEYFVGPHDYRNFCHVDPIEVPCFHRVVHECAVEETELGGLVVTIRAASFLYHQVRCMVAVLLRVGEGLEPPEVVRDMLDISRCPGKPNYPLASELPLVLCDCGYEPHRLAFRYPPHVLDAAYSALWSELQTSFARSSMLQFMAGTVQSLSRPLACEGLREAARSKWEDAPYTSLLEDGTRFAAPIDVQVSELGAARKTKMEKKKAEREVFMATIAAREGAKPDAETASLDAMNNQQ
eukprot:m51a1_g1273 putative trna pseudouridine(38 39) synthase (694) ;mRNA; f:99807-102749